MVCLAFLVWFVWLLMRGFDFEQGLGWEEGEQ